MNTLVKRVGGLASSHSPRQSIRTNNHRLELYAAVIIAFLTGLLVQSLVHNTRSLDICFKYGARQTSATVAGVVLPTYTSSGNKRLLGDGVYSLTGQQLQRGILSHGDPARLRRFLQTISQADKPIVVSAIGASVMAGHGASWGNNMTATFPDIFMTVINWLSSAYPRADIKAVNSAMGGTASMFHDTCSDALIPHDSDLVIVEEALGEVDCPDQGCDYNKEKVAAVERLLRKILDLEKKPAVIFLNTYSYQTSKGLYHNAVEGEINVLASYYGIPVLSIRAAAFHEMMKNTRGFRVDYGASAPPPSGGRAADAFYWDSVHPYGATGAKYMADLVIGLLELMSASVSTTRVSTKELGYIDQLLPPPMIPDNYPQGGGGGSSCLFTDMLKQSAVQHQGFAWKSEAPGALTVADQKWGWIAEESGAKIVFKLDTRLPESGPEGKHPKIGIGYLASYQHMGMAMITCIKGCECKQAIIDGHWDARVSLVQSYNLKLTESKRCYIEVTVLPTTNSDGGHKVKIAALTLFQ